MTEVLQRFRSWWRAIRPVWRWALAVLVVTPLVAVGGWGVSQLRYCAPGVARADGGCVGITDGSHGPVFGAASAEALRLLGEENARIADLEGRDVVTVAYVVAIPPPGVEDAYASQLIGDIMGAVVAQRQANGTGTGTGTGGQAALPLIRLLIGNVGDSANPAVEPVRQLIEMAGSGVAENRLMAVAVSGKSLDPLLGVIDELVTAEVPVLISHLTAEQVTSEPVTADSSLARIAPTTSDEAASLVAYLRPSSFRTALIVQNSDREDRYAASLGTGFRKQYPDAEHPDDEYTILVPDEPYLGGATAANAMGDILVNICVQRPDVVLFAGRAAELVPFVAALPQRPCPEHPIHVVTGDDGASFADAVARDEPGLRAGLRANASVVYTALAHPQAWSDSSGDFADAAEERLTGGCAECFPTLFPGESLDDGYAIMAYDAVRTAVMAIRQPDGSVSTPEAVVQKFKRLHGPHAVPGASGWISLDATGSPIDKAVAIMKVVPDDDPVRFLQLSSPSGAPFRPRTPSR